MAGWSGKSMKIHWRRIIWIAVFYWILVTGPYWLQRWREAHQVCNYRVVASCEP
jgi:hypothetical protein